jgi:hypothetical protein
MEKIIIHGTALVLSLIAIVIAPRTITTYLAVRK